MKRSSYREARHYAVRRAELGIPTVDVCCQLGIAEQRSEPEEVLPSGRDAGRLRVSVERPAGSYPACGGSQRPYTG